MTRSVQDHPTNAEPETEERRDRGRQNDSCPAERPTARRGVFGSWRLRNLRKYVADDCRVADPVTAILGQAANEQSSDRIRRIRWQQRPIGLVLDHRCERRVDVRARKAGFPVNIS